MGMQLRSQLLGTSFVPQILAQNAECIAGGKW